jgi:hypothetical protein
MPDFKLTHTTVSRGQRSLAAPSVEYWLTHAGVPAVVGAVTGLAEVLGSLDGAAVVGVGAGFVGAVAVTDPALHSPMNTFFVFPLA